MTATNDDLLAVLNEIRDILKPVTQITESKVEVFHDGKPVELDELTKTWKLKK